MFEGPDDKVYELSWTELLEVDTEIPFSAYDDLKCGTEVLAPWNAGRSTSVQFSKASVISEEEKSQRATGNSVPLPFDLFSVIAN